VIAGYESGFTAVHLVPRNQTGVRGTVLSFAQTIYLSQPHKQPILSIDALPDGSTYFSSSADAIIAAHRIPELPPGDDAESMPPENLVSSVNIEVQDSKADAEELTTHAGVAGSSNAALKSVNSDSESPERLSFPKTRQPTKTRPASDSAELGVHPSGLSSLLASAPSQPKLAPAARRPSAVTIQPAYKAVITKHAGQQSLRVRSDGRLLVTGGWDSRVRVYSTKTLKEVAVLKWHKEGVYAVAFGESLEKENVEMPVEKKKAEGEAVEVVKKETGLAKLQRQREEAVQIKHWVAAGAKDGKVSLWEVF
jgi:WD40 repeat protein